MYLILTGAVTRWIRWKLVRAASYIICKTQNNQPALPTKISRKPLTKKIAPALQTLAEIWQRKFWDSGDLIHNFCAVGAMLWWRYSSSILWPACVSCHNQPPEDMRLTFSSYNLHGPSGHSRSTQAMTLNNSLLSVNYLEKWRMSLNATATCNCLTWIIPSRQLFASLAVCLQQVDI